MTKGRTTSEIDTDLIEIRAQITTAGKKADQHDADHFKYLDADPPDLNGAERSAAARDRMLLEKTAYERRIPGLEAERAAAIEREAAEAEAAAQKALEAETRQVGKEMIAVFGDATLERQIQTLEAARSLIWKINSNRSQKTAGHRRPNIEPPNEVRVVMQLQLWDPRTGELCWDFKNGDRRQKAGRKAA